MEKELEIQTEDGKHIICPDQKPEDALTYEENTGLNMYNNNKEKVSDGE